MSDSTNQLPQWIADHVKLYREDPEKAHMWDASKVGGKGILPTLLLTSTGRKSGELKSLPLIYKKIGDNYVIIASKGGATSHPAWYLNLKANPECHVQVSLASVNGIARTATGSEREDCWNQLVEVYPSYGDYQKTTDGREIPVVIIEPR